MKPELFAELFKPLENIWKEVWKESDHPETKLRRENNLAAAQVILNELERENVEARQDDYWRQLSKVYTALRDTIEDDTTKIEYQKKSMAALEKIKLKTPTDTIDLYEHYCNLARRLSKSEIFDLPLIRNYYLKGLLTLSTIPRKELKEDYGSFIKEGIKKCIKQFKHDYPSCKKFIYGFIDEYFIALQETKIFPHFPIIHNCYKLLLDLMDKNSLEFRIVNFAQWIFEGEYSNPGTFSFGKQLDLLNAEVRDPSLQFALELKTQFLRLLKYLKYCSVSQNLPSGCDEWLKSNEDHTKSENQIYLEQLVESYERETTSLVNKIGESPNLGVALIKRMQFLEDELHKSNKKQARLFTLFFNMQQPSTPQSEPAIKRRRSCSF